ncbi:MAG: type II secretion system F family protein [Clostridia bacterium]
MIILFSIISLSTLILIFLSKDKYNEELINLDLNTFRFKMLMPSELFLLDLIKCNYKTKFSRKIYSKISELYGSKNSYFYYRMHLANKLSLINIGLLVLTLLGTFIHPEKEYFVFCILILLGIYLYCDNEISKNLKVRKLEIQIDFPIFLNKLTLLINAGMTMSRAMEKITYENKKESALYTELEKTVFEIKSGMSEIRAYEDFAKRCRTSEVTKFISIVLQNLKKGSFEVVSILRVQSEACWETRKNVAKKLGEEASTKLLLPMMIIFLAILIIVITPAILSMQSI